MLIINADDLGINRVATDNIILCFKASRISSASAMLFMEDSLRAADLALEHGLDAGLHLNFTDNFTGDFKSGKLCESQLRIRSFLRTNKYCSLLYNPFLKSDFHYVFTAQYEEYVRLYKKEPSHIDGHHHMHLCVNMLLDGLITRGSRVRRNHTFSSGEKSGINRLYRYLIDGILMRRYICTNFFFGSLPHRDKQRLLRILNMAKIWNVELEVHPEKKEEFEYLMSDEFISMISVVETGDYALLLRYLQVMPCHR